MACRYTYLGKTYEAHEFDDVLRAMQPSEASKYMNGVASVPSAPMIGDTKSWTALALKRMIAYAAENGFDSIAWTTGEQQADRYSLAKQVDSVSWTDWPSAGKDMGILTASKGGEQVIKQTIARNDLEDHIGKEVARKLLEQPDDIGGRKTLEGESLKVGGEGMKGYYDQIVPQVANDIIKKFGGKVDAVAIEDNRGNAVNGKRARWVIEVGGKEWNAYSAKDVAEDELRELIGNGKSAKLVDTSESSLHQPGFTITPELRSKVLNEGMPLFSKGMTAMQRVSAFWKAVASNKNAFKYGEVELGATTADDIAKQISTAQQSVEGSENDAGGADFSTGDGWLHVVPANDKRNSEGGYAEYMIQAPGAKSEGKLSGGGSLMYQAAMKWIYANGGKFVKDGQLTEINKLRVTSNQLSSALRENTTDHLDPDGDQGIVGWQEGDTDSNIAALAIREMELSHERIPELNDYTFDFSKARIVDKAGKEILAGEIRELLSRVDPEFAQGVGTATAARAIATRAALQGRNLGSGAGSNLQQSGVAFGEDRVLYSRSTQRPLDLQGGEAGNAASWDSPESSKLDDIIYTLQDKHIDMKRVVAAIKDAGGKLIEKFNPYLAEELFHGRAAKRTHDFVNTELKPLLTDMQMRGLTVEELDQYLHARHAKEANALIAERDPNMPDGGSGMTDAEADEYMAGLGESKRKRLEATAAKVDAIIAKTRDLYVSYGLISKDQADSWAQMFQHYVPLMREDHDGGMGLGQGFSIKGKEVKHRTGSTAKVVDILANIALQREKAITRGEKNRVAVALAGLVKMNPNPDFWTFGKPPVERVLNEKTGLVEDRIDPMFKSRENVVVAKIKDSSGEVHERAIIFNEDNERAMRMAESFKNLDHIQLGGVMGVSAMITRYFASVNTQYNPVFGIVNIARDVQGMALNLSSTPLAKHRADVLKLIPSAVKGIYLDSRAERKGGAANSKWAQLWEELQDEGGMTGYRDLYLNSSERANEIKRELDPTKWHNSKLGKIFTANGALKVPLTVAQEKAGWLFDWLSDYNQTLEGATRLAAYKVAIDNGMTKQQAASLAKNITVNFNRKGHIGQQAGALYAFFNAAMQGTARIAQTMLTYENGKVGLTKAGKAIVYGGMTMGAMQAVMLAAAGFDDDEPPEFVRERAMIIPIGGKKYITIPMPLGFHVFPNLGRIPTEWALGGFKDTGKRVADMVGIFIEAFNPMGSAGMSLQTLMPTAIDPLVALAENKDWTGKPIYKEDFNSMKPTPGFERNKDTATAWAKGIAEGLNFLSGGTDYTPGAISPTADQIDYLIGQVTGGVGRELGKIAQTGESAVTGEALPPHKVPLLGRFYGNAENQSSQGNAYYSNLKRIFQVEAEIKGRLEDRLPIDEYKADNPEWKLITRAKYADNIIGKLKKQKRALIERGAEREKIRAIEDRITNEMRRLNEAVRMLEEKEAA